MQTFSLAAPLALFAAACAQAPPTPPTADWPWPRVPGSDGRSSFQLETIQRNRPSAPGGNDTWQLQGEIEHDDPAVLLSDLYATIRVTTDDGAERLFGREKTTLDAAYRHVVLSGLDLGPDPKRITALEIELRLVCPKSWATATESLDADGAKRTVLLPPFEFGLVAGENGVTVTAYANDASLGAGPRRAVWDLLSHRWAAGAATVRSTDTSVSDEFPTYRPFGGSGSGGATSCHYAWMLGTVFFARGYPTTVALRVPDEVETELVHYRFTGLDLTSVPRPR